MTKEELSEYESNNEPASQWDKGEEFLIALQKIPFSDTKLQIWSFTYDHTENYDEKRIRYNEVIPSS